jgi:hypothetical protein
MEIGCNNPAWPFKAQSAASGQRTARLRPGRHPPCPCRHRFASVSLMNARLINERQATRVFVSACLFDFMIRIAVNPRSAPGLSLGLWRVPMPGPRPPGQRLIRRKVQAINIR